MKARRKTPGPGAKCTIYVLREKADGPIFYVGQTQLKPEMRLRWHLKVVRKKARTKERMTKAQKWVYSLLSLGVVPLIEVIDKDGKWDTSEAVWIDRLRAEGMPLTNVLGVVGPAPIVWRDSWDAVEIAERHHSF